MARTQPENFTTETIDGITTNQKPYQQKRDLKLSPEERTKNQKILCNLCGQLLRWAKGPRGHRAQCSALQIEE